MGGEGAISPLLSGDSNHRIESHGGQVRIITGTDTETDRITDPDNRSRENVLIAYVITDACVKRIRLDIKKRASCRRLAHSLLIQLLGPGLAVA